MNLRDLASAAAGRVLAAALASCGAWVGGSFATWADTHAVHVAADRAARPVGRLVAPRLGDSRMVLAGAGLPLPVSGPGHFLLAPWQGRDGAVLLLAAPEPAPGFVTRIGSGDPLVLEFGPGEQALYRVTHVQWVTDPSADDVYTAQAPALMLLSRVPATEPDVPETWYIVTARPVDLGVSL